MTDTERIQEIIRAKNLNNIQFCSATGISPASLSHITSNRSKPTLTILRNVINGFPDINPEWIMMGTGSMFRNNETPYEQEEKHQQTDFNEIMSQDKLPLLFGDEEPEPMKNLNVTKSNAKTWGTSANSGNIEEIVKTTINAMQKPQRKIVEVRIFFDDGTYESFSTKLKA